jgi:hypothetical protein
MTAEEAEAGPPFSNSRCPVPFPRKSGWPRPHSLTCQATLSRKKIRWTQTLSQPL